MFTLPLFLLILTLFAAVVWRAIRDELPVPSPETPAEKPPRAWKQTARHAIGRMRTRAATSRRLFTRLARRRPAR